MIDEKCYQDFLKQNPYPRSLISYDRLDTVYLYRHGKRLINFSSNDYLGLAQHPKLIQQAQLFAEKYGVGSTSSRLVAGNLSLYDILEKKIAAAIGKPAALILGTGYQTNISVLSALLDAKVLGQEPLIFCDKLCHVSLLLGAQSAAKLRRFQHNDCENLEWLLKKYAHESRPKCIIVESVYSMDGDCAPLSDIIALAKKYQAMLYVDDAHAVGVYGFGKAADYAADIDIIMGTFSKALGSFGGYIVCSETIKQYLVNKCKGLIYSTGLPPTVLGAISAAVELLPELTPERNRVLRHAQRLRDFFYAKKIACGQASTHIMPWIIGDAEKARKISLLLEENGIVAATIRPPSVPQGKSRIRFCLSAAHSDADLNQLMDGIQKVNREVNERQSDPLF